jgi:hypothetical protein
MRFAMLGQRPNLGELGQEGWTDERNIVPVLVRSAEGEEETTKDTVPGDPAREVKRKAGEHHACKRRQRIVGVPSRPASQERPCQSERPKRNDGPAPLGPPFGADVEGQRSVDCPVQGGGCQCAQMPRPIIQAARTSAARPSSITLSRRSAEGRSIAR